MQLGNFALYNNSLGVIVKIEETVIGDIVTFFDLETDQIYRLRESHIKSYVRRKRGSKPADSMSDAQRNAIRAIKYNLNVKFNGRSLDDVSMFIGLFKAESVKRYRQNKDFERMLFEGQTSHDLFHS
jgi:hypothetical protein